MFMQCFCLRKNLRDERINFLSGLKIMSSPVPCNQKKTPGLVTTPACGTTEAAEEPDEEQPTVERDSPAEVLNSSSALPLLGE